MTDTTRTDTAGDREPDLLARARRALLDALDALQEHRNSVVVIGAQAIYLHTGAAATPVAEATKDSDLAIDVRHLANQPHIDAAMRAAAFELDTTKNQPGAWVNAEGIPVDLMVPETLAGPATEKALTWLRDLFAAGPDATGSQMAARAEAPFGTADTVAISCAVLAQDALNAV